MPFFAESTATQLGMLRTRSTNGSFAWCGGQWAMVSIGSVLDIEPERGKD